jgi:hypothetical protein
MSEFRIYKPRKDKDGKFVGAASAIQVVDKKVKKGEREFTETMVFWTSTPQTGEDANGNSSFDWKSEKNPNGKQVVMSLGDPDIGELLAVLNGLKKKVGQPSGKGLYHQTNENANSAMSFEHRDSNDAAKYDSGYIVTVSKKVGPDLVKVSHSLSLAEGEILKVILTDAIRRKYWVS